MKPILAVLILYKMQLAESFSYTALSRELREHPALAERIELTVFDNSAEPQPLPANFAGSYLHDRTNPGISSRYQQALELALQGGATWIMLLDQDTVLTHAYLTEAVDLTSRLKDDQQVAAIVPKLISHGRLLSPHPPSYRGHRWQYDLSTKGLMTDLLRTFNSGAIQRVAALAGIGGYPREFWLDYTDHATFHRLQTAGGKIWVMDVALEHDLNMLQKDHHTGSVNAFRHRIMLTAELCFYRHFGTCEERRRHRIDLFRRALSSARERHFSEALRHLKAGLSPRPAAARRPA